MTDKANKPLEDAPAIKTIVCALDLTHNDDNLLKTAIRISLQNNAELNIVHVMHVVRVPGLMEQLGPKNREVIDHIESLLATYDQDKKLDYKIHIERGGHLSHTISQYVLKVNADLLIVGGLNHEHFVPDFIRTTGEELVNEIECNLLICKQPIHTAPTKLVISATMPETIFSACNLVRPSSANARVWILTSVKGSRAFIRSLKKMLGVFSENQDDFQLKVLDVLRMFNVRKTAASFIFHSNRSIEKSFVQALALQPDIFVLERSKQLSRPNPELRKKLRETKADLLILGEAL